MKEKRRSGLILAGKLNEWTSLFILEFLRRCKFTIGRIWFEHQTMSSETFLQRQVFSNSWITPVLPPWSNDISLMFDSDRRLKLRTPVDHRWAQVETVRGKRWSSLPYEIPYQRDSAPRIAPKFRLTVYPSSLDAVDPRASKRTPSIDWSSTCHHKRAARTRPHDLQPPVTPRRASLAFCIAVAMSDCLAAVGRVGVGVSLSSMLLHHFN